MRASFRTPRRRVARISGGGSRGPPTTLWRVPQLVLPTPSVRESFLEAMEEFVAEGVEFSQTAAWIDRHAPGWQEPAAFEEFVEAVRADALEQTPRPEWHVP